MCYCILLKNRLVTDLSIKIVIIIMMIIMVLSELIRICCNLIPRFTKCPVILIAFSLSFS